MEGERQAVRQRQRRTEVETERVTEAERETCQCSRPWQQWKPVTLAFRDGLWYVSMRGWDESASGMWAVPIKHIFSIPKTVEKSS